VSISSIDLSIIIGNALDNAIEAASKLKEDSEKEIFVLVKHHQNNIIIVIKNRFEGEVDANCLSTTKSDQLNHGFGIPEIKQLAAKYGGVVAISCEDRTFELRIVLRNSNDA
jgi:sensor histidine kinase regulating citrate/malate metabolism